MVTGKTKYKPKLNAALSENVGACRFSIKITMTPH